MITVAVIGAEGKSGQQFVRAALTQGWRVRAGVHQTGAREFKPSSSVPQDYKKIQQPAINIFGNPTNRTLKFIGKHDEEDMKKYVLFM